MRDHPGDMHRTSSGRRNAGAESHLAVAERLTPEWGPWFRLLRLTLPALEDAAWSLAERLAADRGPRSPLLHRAVVAVPERLARMHVTALIDAAVRERAPGRPAEARRAAGEVDVLQLVGAAIRLDRTEIEQVAARAGEEADALLAVAQLAVMPVLHACRRQLADTIPHPWSAAYCPICAAWPTLAELRGLDRERHLRCARCGADWRAPLLLCAFCGETDHDALGSLLPEGQEQTRRVDVCRSCNGYMKTLATLQAIAPAMLPVEDLNTLDLDIAARDRGYGRPERSGVDLAIEIHPAPAPPVPLWGRR